MEACLFSDLSQAESKSIRVEVKDMLAGFFRDAGFLGHGLGGRWSYYSIAIRMSTA